MNLFGPYYPFALRAVMRHAERLSELLTLREWVSVPSAPGHGWIRGRAAEVRCVAAVFGRDWHDGHLTAETSAVELARYIHSVHQAMAEHFGPETPSCCRIGFPFERNVRFGPDW